MVSRVCKFLRLRGRLSRFEDLNATVTRISGEWSETHKGAKLLGLRTSTGGFEATLGVSDGTSISPTGKEV
jgi:hypothetical protein